MKEEYGFMCPALLLNEFFYMIDVFQKLPVKRVLNTHQARNI